MKQLIIARKDLDMSPGKLASQVSHASIAFLTHKITENVIGLIHYTEPDDDILKSKDEYVINSFYIDKNTYDDWINGSFTKIICGAKNKYQLEKVYAICDELGLRENIDYFLIKDKCLTEIEPEEFDNNGVGRTLTCIGFRPLPDKILRMISRNYQLY